ncbi:MAG: hypothetical protein ACXWYS_00735 [Gaiellaceae bacterium]
MDGDEATDVLDVDVVLLPEDGTEVHLSPGERRALLEQFPAVEREARKWRAMTGYPGRIVVIQEAVIAAFRRGDFSQ